MPIEINNLTASAQIGAKQPAAKLTPADIEMIAEKVIQILERRKTTASMARADNSARSILGNS